MACRLLQGRSAAAHMTALTSSTCCCTSLTLLFEDDAMVGPCPRREGGAGEELRRPRLSRCPARSVAPTAVEHRPHHSNPALCVLLCAVCRGACGRGCRVRGIVARVEAAQAMNAAGFWRAGGALEPTGPRLLQASCSAGFHRGTGSEKGGTCSRRRLLVLSFFGSCRRTIPPMPSRS